MNFFGALVFSLVFFGVWSLKETASAQGQARSVSALIALVFLVLAWALGRVV